MKTLRASTSHVSLKVTTSPTSRGSSAHHRRRPGSPVDVRIGRGSQRGSPVCRYATDPWSSAIARWVAAGAATPKISTDPPGMASGTNSRPDVWTRFKESGSSLAKIDPSRMSRSTSEFFPGMRENSRAQGVSPVIPSATICRPSAVVGACGDPWVDGSVGVPAARPWAPRRCRSRRRTGRSRTACSGEAARVAPGSSASPLRGAARRRRLPSRPRRTPGRRPPARSDDPRSP